MDLKLPGEVRAHEWQSTRRKGNRRVECWREVFIEDRKTREVVHEALWRAILPDGLNQILATGIVVEVGEGECEREREKGREAVTRKA